VFSINSQPVLADSRVQQATLPNTVFYRAFCLSGCYIHIHLGCHFTQTPLKAKSVQSVCEHHAVDQNLISSKNKTLESQMYCDSKQKISFSLLYFFKREGEASSTSPI
jgi:hypothetical protein